MSVSVTLDEVLDLAKRLKSVDKVRFIERHAPDIERELSETRPPGRKSLWEACSELGSGPLDEGIAEARRQEWSGFPREDL